MNPDTFEEGARKAAGRAVARWPAYNWQTAAIIVLEQRDGARRRFDPYPLRRAVVLGLLEERGAHVIAEQMAATAVPRIPVVAWRDEETPGEELVLLWTATTPAADLAPLISEGIGAAGSYSPPCKTRSHPLPQNDDGGAR